MRFLTAIALSFVLGCSDGTPKRPTAEPPHEDAGPPGCAAGERPLDDGSCQPPGVRPESCGLGFEPDADRGCTPILPAAPCPPGRLALPGETECHELATCGQGTFGDIPVDATTQFVDAAYAGTDSDGTSAKPWTTIGDAVAAAMPGAVVAIAAGSYPEDVLVTKPVRLWGRCPDMVAVVGTAAGIAAIDIEFGGAKTEVHTLAVRGEKVGIAASGAKDLLVDRVWVHDLARAGIVAEATLGAVSMTIDGVLVEGVGDNGIFADSAISFTVSRTVVRDSKTGPQGAGRGMNLQTSKPTQILNATVSSCLVERNSEIGIFVYASNVTIEATVVQDTQPNAAKEGGRALNIEDMVDKGLRSQVVVRKSVFQRDHDIEVTSTGSDLTMESTTLRDTLPQVSDGKFGRAVGTENRAGPSTLVMRECAIVRCEEVAVFVSGSDATLDSVWIADIGAKSPLGHGRGFDLEFGYKTSERGTATLRWSAIERTHEQGVFVIGSDATLERVAVRDALADAAGDFGDGVTVLDTDQPAKVVLEGSVIERSARAGVSSFGPQGTAELANTKLECNTIQLDAEEDATFVDSGGVECGCMGETATCSVLSSQLTPPKPLGP